MLKKKKKKKIYVSDKKLYFQHKSVSEVNINKNYWNTTVPLIYNQDYTT